MIPFESGFLIGTDGTGIHRTGIGDDTRHSFSQEIVDKVAKQRRTVSKPDHVRLADEQVDPARARRLRAETGIPCGQVVALEIAERITVDVNDVLIHCWIFQVATHERVLLVRIAPPLTY